jgi:hypothetical protein
MKCCTTAAILSAAFLARTAVVADPIAPPPPDTPKCNVFCFRVTDIRADTPAADNEKFHIEFEVLNWADAFAGGLELAVAKPSSKNARFSQSFGNFPELANGIDLDGRPLRLEDTNGDGNIDGDDNEDDNQNGMLDAGEDQNDNLRLDNDPMPGNLNRPNAWTVKSRTATKMVWESPTGVALPYINLLAGDCTLCIKSLPSTTGTITVNDNGDVSPLEAVDNGDNVQDGFVMTIDGLAVGKTIHLNWFLMGADSDVGDVTLPPFGPHCRNARVSDANVPRSEPIGVSGQGNAYGFGLITLTRVDDRPFPPPVFPGNTGLQQSAREFFGGVFNAHEGPAMFAMEFGAGITARFENPADNTNNAKANAGGDPHFTTWGGDKFDFHGECELVLVRNPSFANGLGMHIHGRTKIHDDAHWSFFESIAVQIGDDILEVKGHQQYWINGVENATLLPGAGHMSGYDVTVHTRTRTASDVGSSPAAVEYRFDIDLGDGETIFIRTFNELAWVGFEAPRALDFSGADGLLGNYATGHKLARDGQTMVDDANAFGQEWQVRAEEDPQLFYSINHGPTWPQQCQMPDPRAIERRLLHLRSQGINIIGRGDAIKACTVAADAVEQDGCIFDVLATNNIDIAAAYEQY